ncbi:DUF2017 domain-containing protein [Actinomyces sp. B33]|nr:DUF2017 family protein [Actinomyces sp. B33]MDC4233852.1 DUF2017 domain-containing protein [Actinomyces sp. B33]
MDAFERIDDGYAARIDTDDALVLQRLVDEILVVLDDPGDLSLLVGAATDLETDREAPREGALGRLLPSMSPDPDRASKLRALTEDALRSQKSGRLRRMSARLDEARADRRAVVSEEDAWEWLAALNDLRLGLAGELGLSDDADAERIADLAARPPTGCRSQAAAVAYMVVTWWQDSLLSAMNSPALDH